MRSRLLTTTGLVLGLILLLAVNIFTGTSFSSARLDLTEHKLYTLSQGTRNILTGLDDPLTLRLYLSQSQITQIPGINSYANRVKTLLREYERLSGGKLAVHVIDPEPFSEAEDRAVGYGLRGVPVSADGGSLYFGLVGTSSTDEEEVIPFLSAGREAFLEYDLTKLVHNLAAPEKKVVGLLSSLPIEGGGPQAAVRGLSSPPWMILDQMRQLFEVRSLDAGLKTIPEDIDVLMLVHPRKLSDTALYAIDQFVLGGGRALVFVDAHAEAQPDARPGGMMMPVAQSRRSELDRLLDAWGVVLEKDQIVADLSLAAKVRMEREGRLVAFDYPLWINVPPELYDPDDIVTGNLGNVALGTVGSLVGKDGATTTVTSLIRTTEGAMRFAPKQVELATDPRNLLRDYVPENRAFTLAARVSGPVQTAFPEGRPAARADESGKQDASGEAQAPQAESESGFEHLAQSRQDVNLIVVADTDLLQDRFWVAVQDLMGTRLAIPSAANGTLVVNALDNLLGSSDLISVRNRGSFVRPFERVDALRREAEERFREQEQELTGRLQEAERKLLALEERKQGEAGQSGEGGVILNAAQREEITRFRQERIRIRKALREVRRELHRSIESLEAWIKFMNIALVPLFIGLGGLGVGLWRMRRRRASLPGACA